MRKKRPYLLLELLISITLLALCAIPLISSHPRFIASKIHSLQKVERERVAEIAMSELVEMFKKQKIAWSHIPQYKATGPVIPLGERNLNFALKKAKVRYSLHTLREKTEENGNIYRLLSVAILVDEDSFCYRIIVHRTLDRK